MRRLAIVPAALLASAAIAGDAPEPADAPMAMTSRPCDGLYPVFNPEGCPEKPVTPGDAEGTICHDRIHAVRQANDQPELQRDADRGEDAVMIKAVDQQIDGCNVMIMHHDTTDIRALPKTEREAKLEPAG